MKNDRPVKNIDELSANLYPHLKITNEVFPRILATRKIEDDGAEYFGAFLPKTAVRILMDFLSRTFRLRRCDINIDGSFNVPCTQFYERRCLAPCVESLCERQSYLEMVSLIRLFLANRRAEFLQAVHSKIDALSDELDFEAAAILRDLAESVERFWENKRFNVWLDDTVDSYAVDRSENDFKIFLVTQRGRRALGRKVFTFQKENPGKMLFSIIDSFYRFHLPKEIRVLEDFDGRLELAKTLSARFGHKAKIVVVDPEDRRLSTAFALTEALSESEIDAVRPQASPAKIARSLKSEFDLRTAPARIEAYDVAHISGSGFVAACSVAASTRLMTSEYYFEVSNEKSELATLAASIRNRLEEEQSSPDLIVVDGGKSHLAAAHSTIEATKKDIPVIAAVKPRSKHSEISHFILQNGEMMDFDPSNPAHTLLKLLRDDAHDLANRVHRDLRDMAHHYELASILPSINEAQRRKGLAHAKSLKKVMELKLDELRKIFDPKTVVKIVNDLEQFRSGRSVPVVPLIVPLRYAAENGGAEDLRPISSNR